MGCPAEVEIGKNLVFSVATHDPVTGAVIDADAVPAYRIYEDETGTPILTGNMAKLDDANTTGFYTELIAATAGNGFENGKTYTVHIAATVSSTIGVITYGFIAYDARQTNLIKLFGADLAESGAGQLAAAFNKLFDVAAPLLVASDVMRGTDGANTVVPDAAGVVASLISALNDFDPATDDVAKVILVDTTTDSTNVEIAIAALNNFDPATDTVALVTDLTTKAGFSLSAAGVDAILDEAVEGTITLRQANRVLLAYLAGESNGGGTVTINFRDQGDTKNRIILTVDEDGNRSAVVLDLT